LVVLAVTVIPNGVRNFFQYTIYCLLCVQVKLLARHIGKPMEEIARDIRRPKYFSPSEAVDYGIIDKVNNHHSRPEGTTQFDLATTDSNYHVIQVIYNEKIQEDGGVVSELKRSNLI
jgi:ATP-dependent Clp protease, protease subunit